MLFTLSSTAAAPAPTFDPLTIFMVVILIVLIIFMVRNSRKRKAQVAELQDKMVPGARVMTNFGLYGTLIEKDPDRDAAQIEVAPGVIVDVHKTTLAQVIENSADDELADDGDVADGDVTDAQQGDGTVERP